MQPVKITILGDFIDCQIYRGRLYLWTFDGSIQVYKWNELVNSLSDDENEKLPLKFCFLDGNYLYKNDLVDLFQDSEFKDILLRKFERLEYKDYILSSYQMANFLYGEQDTPKNSIPTDTEIYSSSLYFATEEGLFVASAHRDSKKYPVSSRPKKIWDCNLLSLKANRYPQLALSGGSEGLFELDLSSQAIREPAQISNKHSSFANYNYWSIYNSSNVGNSYLALFGLNEELEKKFGVFAFSKLKRKFNKIVSEGNIFQDNNELNNSKFLSWGTDDKIYRATGSGFEIVRFKNKPDLNNDEKYFTKIREVNLLPWKGSVIGGGTSYFGTIVECENALVILLSNGENLTIQGPITRWRIYPRSINYQNHLHVIKDDRIEIYSFNQDYFLEQNTKVYGIAHRNEPEYRKRFSKNH